LNPRNRRLISDFKKIEEEFSNHKFIKVQSDNEVFPPERYVIKYSGIKGIALSPFSSAENKIIIDIYEHIIEIELHLNYPRYKPLCYIKTDIFHPNFRSANPNEVCIGDFWAPGEGLTEIIYKMGEMIQYKIYNVKSPLNGIAAKWAREHFHLFPIDNNELRTADNSYKNNIDENLEINLL
jgi:ubiquitin-protein ligase